MKKYIAFALCTSVFCGCAGSVLGTSKSQIGFNQEFANPNVGV